MKLTPRKVREMVAFTRLAFDSYALDFVPSWEPRPARERVRTVNHARRLAALRAWDKRREAWAEVLHEYAGDEIALAVFDRVKHTLRPGPRSSLLETFAEYLEWHGDEVHEAQRGIERGAARAYGRESAADYFDRIAAARSGAQ